MDEKELEELMESSVGQVIEWAQAEVNTIDREMLEVFSLPIGVAHLKTNISPEELATIVILCMIASYNLGTRANIAKAASPRTVKLDD